MAYLRNRNTENQNQGMNQNLNTSLSNSENSMIQGTGSNTPNGKTNSSGNFVDMNTYLKNNEKQISEFADKSVSGAINKANETETNINSAKDRFDQSIDRDTFKEDQNWINNVFNDPTNFIKSQDNVNRFHTIRDNKWSGDKSLDDQLNIQNTLKDVDYVDDRARAFQSREGREAILREQNQGTRYSPNLSRLDSALIQGTDYARNKFIDSGKNIETKDLLNSLTSKQNQANEQYQTTRANNTNVSNTNNAMFKTTFDNEKNTLQGYADTVNKDRLTRDLNAMIGYSPGQDIWVPNSNYSDPYGNQGQWVSIADPANPNRVSDAITDDAFKERINSQLGVSAKDYNILRNRDTANKNTVSTMDDIEKMEALNLLGGERFSENYLDRNAYRSASLRSFGDQTNPDLWNQILAIEQARKMNPTGY